MAGTVDLLQRCYTGLELRGDALRFNPALPEELDRLSFRLRYRRHSLSVDLTAAELTVASEAGAAEPVSLMVGDRTFVLQPGAQHRIRLSASRD